MSTDQSFKLLLLTGAGASQKLGRDGMNLPLMQDWCDRLRAKVGPDLAEMAGLAAVRSGPEFEEAIGGLLRARALLDEADKFPAMARYGCTADRVGEASYIEVMANRRRNFARLFTAIHESLFEEFGPQRIDPRRAMAAYQALLGTIAGLRENPTLVCATTKYDRSLELALAHLGPRPRTGFSRAYEFTSPSLEPHGLGQFSAGTPSVMHLHGAVGWFRRDGRIISATADEPYHPRRGEPAVIYPGPQKTAVAMGVWREFNAALQCASHIFVLGHSLHDGHLLAALRWAKGHVAVSVYAPYGDSLARTPTGTTPLGQAQAVRAALPNAHIVFVDFGPRPYLDRTPLDRWCFGLAPRGASSVARRTPSRARVADQVARAAQAATLRTAAEGKARR